MSLNRRLRSLEDRLGKDSKKTPEYTESMRKCDEALKEWHRLETSASIEEIEKLIAEIEAEPTENSEEYSEELKWATLTDLREILRMRRNPNPLTRGF
jgi:hypothetical protein